MDAARGALLRVAHARKRCPRRAGPGWWRRRRRRELAAAASRAAGPVRGQRAPPSSLACLLCSYLDSAARAQEFPVMPPAAPSVARSREGGGIGQRRLVFPKSARRTLPRPIVLCLGLCLAAAGATTPRGESPPRPIRPSDPSKSAWDPECSPTPTLVPGALAPPLSLESHPLAVEPRRGPWGRASPTRGQRRTRSGGRARAPPAAALTPYPSPTGT